MATDAINGRKEAITLVDLGAPRGYAIFRVNSFLSYKTQNGLA